jgi:hypothetical protein
MGVAMHNIVMLMEPHVFFSAVAIGLGIYFMPKDRTPLKQQKEELAREIPKTFEHKTPRGKQGGTMDKLKKFLQDARLLGACILEALRDVLLDRRDNEW